MSALLVLATIGDGLLVVLLMAVSGFVFGPGPESSHGDPSAVASWSIALLICIAAPIFGFVLRSRGRVGIGAAIASLPIAGALLLSSGLFDPSY